ncbi:MAG: phosphatase PAP2 family protein [Nitrospinaceae bacterium]|nr:phosphatase PAP2 family protein [Nitrospinaceae bacterium]
MKSATFLLSVLIMMGGWAHADELAQPEFFEEKFFFDPDFDSLQLTDSRTYTSSPRKRERLRDSQNRLELNRDYFMGIFSDIAYTATSPMRWDDSDWMTAGWVAGGTGLLFILDEEIRDVFESNRSSVTDDISNIFEPFGNGLYIVPALAGFYIFGHFDENAKAKRTALIAAESFLVTGLFVTVMKATFGRSRPSSGESSTTFSAFSTGSTPFPSGHAISAFSIATVIANEYEDVPYIKPISYGIATMTALSRINDEKHWASDVFFGAALGYFTSKALLRLHSNKKGQHFTIYPRVDSNGGGIVLAKRF